MRNVIITGGNGFLGKYTADSFLEQGSRVLSVGRTRSQAPAREGLTCLTCDISDTDELKRGIPEGVYDTFIHFAWAGASGPDRADYDLQMKNALMTVECMKTARELGCSRFLCAGSIMEYEAEAAVRAQGCRPGMGYIYGMAKHAAHGLCKAVAADIGIDLIWPILTNAFGPGESSPRFINTTLRKMNSGEPLQFTAASQTYDFVYVTDAAKAFRLIAEKGRPFCGYIIGSGNPRPLKEYILEMRAMFAPEAELRFGDIPFTGIDLPREAFSIENTVRDTGFRPEVSFSDGIKRTMEWLRRS